jgi:hypothetical protein
LLLRRRRLGEFGGCINLPQAEADNEPLPEGYPEEADPIRLFRGADRFLTLSKRSLEHGVSTKNVVERLFHSDCEHHQQFRQHYCLPTLIL